MCGLCTWHVAPESDLPADMDAFHHTHGVPDVHEFDMFKSEQAEAESAESDASQEMPTLKEQTWTAINDPGSSTLAAIWSIFVSVAIVAAVALFILDTDPTFYTPPGASPPLLTKVIDISTTILFTFEILLTIWAAPSLRALYDLAFMVDIAVVLPSYIEFISGHGRGPSLSVLRVFRLLRVLRLFRVSRRSTALLINAVKRSTRVLLMLIMLLSIAVTVLGALMHALERGDWDASRRDWSRDIAWQCLYDVDIAADGHLQTSTGSHYSDLGPDCQLHNDNATTQVYACVVPVETGRNCIAADWDSSPFGSVPAAIWWALVTICTVGA